MSPLDDAGLLVRVGAGDKAAMKLLYDEHSDALYHFIRTRLRDPFEAADVVQEVFLEIGAQPHGFRAAPQ